MCWPVATLGKRRAITSTTNALPTTYRLRHLQRLSVPTLISLYRD